MRRSFADSFYFFALLNKRDQAHGKAVAQTGLIEELVTTDWVLTELADRLATSRNRAMFVQTRRELLADKNVHIVPFDMDLYEDGVEMYRTHGDKQWSLTDCISFVVMRRENIAEALTGDHHYEQAGFTALLK